jgi:hypothetical protein
LEGAMSHRDAEELAAEIAYMQDDPSFRPKKDPLNEPDSLEASIERLEFKNKKLHDYIDKLIDKIIDLEKIIKTYLNR